MSSGDRFSINQSASNLLFCTYASSGIIGVLTSFNFCISFITVIKFFIKKNKYEPHKFSSCITILALMMRSILETSYGVLIDFIIFVFVFQLSQKKFMDQIEILLTFL